MDLKGLEKCQVSGVPNSIIYVPDFITAAEEEYLLKNVYNAPKPKWTQLLNRRLQNWGGLPHLKGMVTEPIPEWLNNYCRRVSDIGVFDGKVANHVLVNEYKSGQGIMPHLDGDLYYPTVSTISLGSHTILNFYQPADCTDEGGDVANDMASVPEDISESGHGHPSDIFAKRHVASILLERRSLVLVKDDMYKIYLHGISEVSEDCFNSDIANRDMCSGLGANDGDKLPRSTRVSLTIRHVPKTIKLKLPFGKR